MIGGLAREFYHRIWRHYEGPEAWRWQERSEYGNRGQGTPAVDGAQRTMWIFEPHVAEQVFEDWVAEHAIDVRREERLDRANGVSFEDGRIRSIATEGGSAFAASAFIDATYEGDLLAAAGVSYSVGREGTDTYGEDWAGVQKDARHHGHFFPEGVDPYVIPGDPTSGLLPRISVEPPGPDGSADNRIQAYCFRLCLTRVPENRVPFPQPEGYDPSQYELILRVFETGWRETFRKFDPIPNGKTDTNNHGPFSTDNIGMNYAYPEASYAASEEIVAEHERYQKGECLAKRPVPGSIGMGSYAMDSHNVQRYVTSDGFVQNEGDIGVKPLRPYGIAFGSIVPKRQEVTNLLVPVCVSSSHIAYGSIRMEPVFMILGQSAATAAVLSIEDGVAIQDLDYGKLRTRLLADGQILELED